MRKFICLCLLLPIIASCVPSLAGLSSKTDVATSASLGPDDVGDEERQSSLPARIAAGVSWLWASYTALKAKNVDVSALREAISEMQDVVNKGDLGAALSLYGKARAIVTMLAGVV